MSEQELLAIFPEGRAILIKKARRTILEAEYWLEWISKERKKIKAAMMIEPYEQLWIREDQLKINYNDFRDWHQLIRHMEWRIKFLQGKVKPSKNSINEEDIYQAKQIKIQSFYSDRLRRQGNKLWGKCPWHMEETASFCIYTSQNTWWCYACNLGGSSIDYIMKLNNLTFIEAVKYLLRK